MCLADVLVVVNASRPPRRVHAVIIGMHFGHVRVLAGEAFLAKESRLPVAAKQPVRLNLCCIHTGSRQAQETDYEIIQYVIARTEGMRQYTTLA